MNRIALVLFISVLSCTAENPADGVAEHQDLSGSGDLSGGEPDSGPADLGPVVPAEERAVTFEAADGLLLEGTLSLPERRTQTEVTGIVLVHGSGPQGRDELLPLSLPNIGTVEVMPFRDLAETFSEAGYAVLRYDKRTCGTFNNLCENEYPLPLEPMVSDFMGDASAALDFIASQPGVNPDSLLIMGHSQGGSFVPLLMAERSDLVAGVMLAGPYNDIDFLISYQLEANRELLQEIGYNETDIEAILASTALLEADLEDLEDGSYEGENLSDYDVTFWLEWFDITASARVVMEELTRPVLAVSGEIDMNVPPQETLSWGELFDGLEDNPGHDAVVLWGVTHALNRIENPDWIWATEEEVGTTVAETVLEEVFLFLNSAISE